MGTKSSEVENHSSEDEAGLRRELEDVKKRNDELLTRLKYAQADLENYRKRMEKEMKEAGEAPLKGLLARLLVVQDELDLAARHSDGEGARRGDTIREGIAMVRRNLAAALESAGLQRIEPVGGPFDPRLHEAVEKVQGSSHEGDIVIEEVRPGFVFRGQLLRPSMVKVELGSRAAKEEKAVE